MIIERPTYVKQLIEKKNNGMVKIITGIRRSGKSFLLFNLFHRHLNECGIKDENIIELALDDDENIMYRNPIKLGEYIRGLISDTNQKYYIFLDEIQKVQTIKNPYLENSDDTVGFVDVLLGLMKKPNADVYVTGSNSKMLSTDILTEFRGRGDEIRVFPLSYKEFYDAFSGDKHNAWREFFTYGGMPYILSLTDHRNKARYLAELFDKIYISDIISRHNINNKGVLDTVLDIVSSSIGALTNPLNISKTFRSVEKTAISSDTITKYLDYFTDAFLISKAARYDVKGRKYIGSPLKYYFTDIGLRNSRINFRQTEENHIMENIIYNELVMRGYSVDIGVVEYNYSDENGKSKKSNLEVDFIANDGNKRYYIQSALTVGEEPKRLQETKPFGLITDSFKKIVVVKDDIVPWYDVNGILYVGIERFLIDSNCLNL